MVILFIVFLTLLLLLVACKTMNSLASPDDTYAAIHGMELSEINIRMLLLRHGFLWSTILDENGSIYHELRLNSMDDNWSAGLFLHISTTNIT